MVFPGKVAPDSFSCVLHVTSRGRLVAGNVKKACSFMPVMVTASPELLKRQKIFSSHFQSTET